MGIRVPLVLLLLLVAPLSVLAPTASACVSGPSGGLPGASANAAIPCGRIYPLILITTEAKTGTLYDLDRGAPLVVDALLTFTFDAAKDGYTPAAPNEPITISFEFPRKPAWAEMAVEPARVDVPVNDPTKFKADPADPANPKLTFEFSVPIQVAITLTGQPVLKDGLDYHKLLVFAKSSESGIFQSGYGIKEFRVVPEGALHEADVAGTRDVYVATPLPADVALSPVTRSFGGATVTLTPPAKTLWWQPQPFEFRIEPAPAGKLVAAVHDEAGDLVAQSPVLDAAGGTVALNVTLVRPGLHTATLTVLPDAGTRGLPVTHALDFRAGDLSVEGVQFPKLMLVAVSEPIPAPVGSPGATPQDALVQFERDVPFYAFDTAQGVTVAVSVRGSVPVPVGGAGNLQFSVLDPDGKLLQTSSVDPANPAKSFRIGSVPAEGWYTLRVSGIGAPVGAAFDAAVEVTYVQAPQARNRADGLPDPTPDTLGRGGLNLTLPVDGLQVWAPGALTPQYADLPFLHATTVTDADGALVQATRLREGAATFSPPWPGAYRAFVHVQPMPGGQPFSPLVRAFTFTVGEGQTTVAQTFSVEDAYALPTAAGASVMGVYALPRVDGGRLAPDASGLAVQSVGGDGAPAEGTSSADPRWLLVSTAGPTRGEDATFAATAEFPAPVTLTGPSPVGAQGAKGASIPGLAVGLVLAALGVVAVGAALLRRRG